MDSDLKTGFILGVSLSAVFAFVVLLSVKENAIKTTQREAVAAGHAEFVADKEGNVEFKWKEIK